MWRYHNVFEDIYTMHAIFNELKLTEKYLIKILDFSKYFSEYDD